jgi:NADH-quinone oxidoreductase subunit E
MLNAEEKQLIEQAVRHYEHPRAACLEALKIVQERRGWVSDDDVRDVADALAMSPAEVDSLATFYSLIFRRPVGRHVILVCDSVSCWIMGYERIVQHISERLGVGLGETTPDGEFTLLPVVCLGACDRAPAMMIDGDLHGDLTEEVIDQLLVTYRGKKME